MSAKGITAKDNTFQSATFLSANDSVNQVRPYSSKEVNKDTFVATSSSYFAAAMDDDDVHEASAPAQGKGGLRLPIIQVTVDCETEKQEKIRRRSKHEKFGGKDIVFEASHSSEPAPPKRKSKLEKKEEVLEKYTMGSDFSFVPGSPLQFRRQLAYSRNLSSPTDRLRPEIKDLRGLPELQGTCYSRRRACSLSSITEDIKTFQERRDRIKQRPGSLRLAQRTPSPTRPPSASPLTNEHPFLYKNCERAKSPGLTRSVHTPKKRSYTLPSTLDTLTVTFNGERGHECLRNKKNATEQHNNDVFLSTQGFADLRPSSS